MTVTVLQVEQVRKSIGGVKILDGVSLTVNQGERRAVIGPNGAGKTTTLRMIVNIFTPDAGRIHFRGRPVADLPPRVFGYLPGERGLYPCMRLREQLIFFRSFPRATPRRPSWPRPSCTSRTW